MLQTAKANSLKRLTEGKKMLNEALTLAKLGSWKFNFSDKKFNYGLMN